jgi:parallel beta-helix repeat protein
VNALGNDGPFVTLKRARDAIREQRNRGITTQFTILVRGGTYRLNETLTLGPEDSGTNDRPLIIRAYGNERPVLSGSKLIGGFTAHTSTIYKTDLKGSVIESRNVRQLFADGKRQILARFPNFDPRDPIGGGFLYVEDSAEDGSKFKFKYRTGDVRNWANPVNAEIVIYPGPNYWNNIITVAGYDKNNRIVELAGNTSYPITAGNRYFFQNIFEELDSPGEWYFDKQAKLLYFWPEKISSLNSVSIPVLKSIIEIKGKTLKGKYKGVPSHIRIEGFILDGCEGTAVIIKDAEDISIAANTVRNAGEAGIVIENGRNNVAIGNDIYAVGSEGILISGGDRATLNPGANRAENNYVHHVGVFRKTSSGIDCRGVGNVVSHNLIHSTPRIGIQFDGNDHIIEYNHVHHVNEETQDSGSIYTCARDWTKRGSIVRYNYIRGSGGYGRNNAKEPWQSPFKTYGIYLDDSTSGTEVYGNIVTKAYRGIIVHGGRDNIIENNIIVDSEKSQIVYSSIPPTDRELPGMFKKISEMGYTKYPLLSSITSSQQGTTMSGNKFQRNVVYYANAKPSLYDIYGTLDLITTVSDFNTIYAAGTTLLIPYTKATPAQQWKFWQDKGMDRNSLLADPLFVDAVNGNFTLASGSPVLKTGFKQIPFEKIGPYNDPRRASWPIK